MRNITIIAGLILILALAAAARGMSQRANRTHQMSPKQARQRPKRKALLR